MTIFFLGLVFDLIASCQVKMQSVWKLKQNQNNQLPYESILLPNDWLDRMKSHPNFQTNKSERLKDKEIPFLRPSLDEMKQLNPNKNSGSVDWFHKYFIHIT